MTDETLPDPPAGALPLSEAIARFTPPDLWSEYQRKTEKRRVLPRRPVFHREGDNSAAKEARRVQADLNRLLRRIKQTLVDRLIAGELIGYGQTDEPFGPWRQIPAAAWRGLQVKDIRKGRVGGPSSQISGIHILEACAAPAPDPDQLRNDAPGRPSRFHVIEAEFDQRAEAGAVETNLSKQADALAAWYAATYPGYQPYRPATIRNRLRAKYREALLSIT